MNMQSSCSESTPKWHHPADIMKLHQLKMKKKALKARIRGGNTPTTSALNSSGFSSSDGHNNSHLAFDDVLSAKKRKNPFIIDKENKRTNRPPPDITTLDESSDQTLFKLLHHTTTTTATPNPNTLSFNNLLQKINDQQQNTELATEIVKGQGETWLPIDWTLKSKVRLWSSVPFPWHQLLKLSEEASGVTGFTRCVDNTALDIAPNAKFHQCSLYWQQPSLPWLTLFPRNGNNHRTVVNAMPTVATNATIRTSLQMAWSDSLRSLFQLIRTKQCPYFYAHANTFTVLFRAAGICGFSDVHAIITPTTRGFRELLRQADIEFTMPLKRSRNSSLEDQATTITLTKDEDEAPDESWLKTMGCNADDIKNINYNQTKVERKVECAVDNSEQSLVFVEGSEIHGLYNFLINCKSATATTGALAGIPPTLLAPVAFNGATLNALKVRETKVHQTDCDYYSLELSGPILPSTIHNLFGIHSSEHSVSATFVNVASTVAFSQINRDMISSETTKGNMIFDKENLSDCGLSREMIKEFCSPDSKHITNVECLKYNSENKTYSWT